MSGQVVSDELKEQIVIMVIVGGLGTSEQTRVAGRQPALHALRAVVEMQAFKALVQRLERGVRRSTLKPDDLPVCLDLHHTDVGRVHEVLERGLDTHLPEQPSAQVGARVCAGTSTAELMVVMAWQPCRDDEPVTEDPALS
jgi:hypothetical protein